MIPCTNSFRACAVAVMAATLPAPVTAQKTAQKLVGGLVRSADRTPLAGAAVRFYPAPTAPIAALTKWQHLLAGQARPETVATSARGSFRLRTARAFGALLVRHPADAPTTGFLRLGAQPLGTIQCAALATVKFAARADVHVQAVDRTGRSFALGAFPATEQLRLPAGEYRFLVIAGTTVHEFRRTLQGGKTTAAPAAPSGVRPVSVAKGSALTIALRDWPRVRLPQVAPNTTAMPQGETPVPFLVHQPIPAGRLLTHSWLDDCAISVEPAPFQPFQILIQDADEQPIRGAYVVTGAEGRTGFELHTQSRSNRSGRASVPGGCQGWLLVWARDHACVAHRLDALGDEPIVLRRAAPLRVRVEDREGQPVRGARLVTESDPEILTMQATTDTFGVATFRHVAAGITAIRLVDRRYRPVTIYPTAGAKRPTVRIRAVEGLKLFGHVRLPGDKPAPRAVVTIRDPAGRGRWTIVADQSGRFELTGLATVNPLRVAAKANIDGRSYISDNLRVQPGEAGWTIQLRSEDPLPPRR